MFRDHFAHRFHALCLLKLGYAYEALGESETAARHLQESLDIFERLRLDHYTARARRALLDCHDDHRTSAGQFEISKGAR